MGSPAEVTAQGLSVGGQLLAPADWITISPESGGTPGTIQVRVAPSGLEPGHHVATVVIIGWPDEVDDRLQAVDVHFFVPGFCTALPLLSK